MNASQQLAMVALLKVRKQAEVFAHVCDTQFAEMARFLEACREAADRGRPINLKKAIPMIENGEAPSKEIRLLQIACKEADVAVAAMELPQ